MLLKLPKTGLEKCFWPLMCYQSCFGLGSVGLENERHTPVLQYSLGTLHIAILLYVCYKSFTTEVLHDSIYIQLMTPIQRVTNSVLVFTLAFKSVFSFREDKNLFYRYLRHLNQKLPLFETKRLLINFLLVTMPVLAICVGDYIKSVYMFVVLNSSCNLPVYRSMVHTLLISIAFDAGSCMYFLSLALGHLNTKLKQEFKGKITAAEADLYKDCLSIIANAYAAFEQIFRTKLSFILMIDTLHIIFRISSLLYYKFDSELFFSTLVQSYIRLFIIGGSSECFHVKLAETRDICYNILKSSPKGGTRRHERAMAKNLRRISDVRLQKIHLGFFYVLDIHLVFSYTMTIIRILVIQFQLNLIIQQSNKTI